MKPIIEATTSTTALARITGFTSKVLRLLQGHQLRCLEIAEQTQKPRNYVDTYLRRLRKYGLAVENDFFWSLTLSGESFSLYLKKFEVKKIKSQHIAYTKTTLRQHLILNPSLNGWIRGGTQGDCEKEVVEVLVNHYNRSGSKYMLFKDHFAMSDMLNINVDVIANALARLRQENIIYLIKDPVQGAWKLGLKRAFLETLQKEASP